MPAGALRGDHGAPEQAPLRRGHEHAVPPGRAAQPGAGRLAHDLRDRPGRPRAGRGRRAAHLRRVAGPGLLRLRLQREGRLRHRHQHRHEHNRRRRPVSGADAGPGGS